MQIPQTYQLLNGDTLHQIANDKYGDYRYWRELAGENDIFSEAFSPGERIEIPSKDEILRIVQDTVSQVLRDNGIDYNQLDLSGLRTANVSSVNPSQIIEWIL